MAIGKKYNVYITHENQDRWEGKKSRSGWVNEQLDREAQEEIKEALSTDPVFDEVTQTWSDAS